jgi:hypothetical protein
MEQNVMESHATRAHHPPSSGPARMNSDCYLLDRRDKEGKEGIQTGIFSSLQVSGNSCRIQRAPSCRVKRYIPPFLLCQNRKHPNDILVPLIYIYIITANCSAGGEDITELSLQFINTTTQLQSQPAANQKVIRSHAARQSHHRRWLQQYGITDTGAHNSARKVAQKPRNVLRSQCQYPINARLPAAVHNSGDLTASLTYNMAGLAGLEPLPSIRGDTGVRNMASLPSLPARNSVTAVRPQLVGAATEVQADSLPASFLNSDWDSLGLPTEQRICSQCRRQLQFQYRPEHTYNPVLALGTGYADPFASLPMEIEPSMRLLLDHCKYNCLDCFAGILSI